MADLPLDLPDDFFRFPDFEQQETNEPEDSSPEPDIPVVKFNDLPAGTFRIETEHGFVTISRTEKQDIFKVDMVYTDIPVNLFPNIPESVTSPQIPAPLPPEIENPPADNEIAVYYQISAKVAKLRPDQKGILAFYEEYPGYKQLTQKNVSPSMTIEEFRTALLSDAALKPQFRAALQRNVATTFFFYDPVTRSRETGFQMSQENTLERVLSKRPNPNLRLGMEITCRNPVIRLSFFDATKPNELEIYVMPWTSAPPEFESSSQKKHSTKAGQSMTLMELKRLLAEADGRKVIKHGQSSVRFYAQTPESSYFLQLKYDNMWHIIPDLSPDDANGKPKKLTITDYQNMIGQKSMEFRVRYDPSAGAATSFDELERLLASKLPTRAIASS